MFSKQWTLAAAAGVCALAGCGVDVNGLSFYETGEPAEAGADGSGHVPEASVADARPHGGDAGGAHDSGNALDAGPAADSGGSLDASGDFGADSGEGDDSGDTVDSPDGVATGASLCADGGLLFCDGFEGDLSAWSTEMAAGGDVSIGTDHVFRGAHALHAHSGAVAGGTPFVKAYVDRTQAWPATVFVRAFVYLEPPYGAASVAGLVNVFASAAPYPGAELDLEPQTRLLGGQGYDDPRLDSAWISTTKLTPSSWHCIELELDSVQGALHAFYEGVEVPDLSHVFAGPIPPLNVLQLGLGFSEANPQPASDIWIDEVAASGVRVGCDR
jgi:hypothetical protein